MSAREMGAGWYVVLATFVLLLGILGYGGYAIYPRFNLPLAVGATLVLLAATAGVAALFSPCSFALLTTLLAREVGEGPGRGGRALRFGMATALGAATFLLLTGAGIAFGAGARFERVTFASDAGRSLRLVVGAGLVLLGLIQLERLPLSFGVIADAVRPLFRRQAALRRHRPTLGFALYGFGYILAGFG